MTKLLMQLLTDFVGAIANKHKGVMRSDEEFYDTIEPMLLAISAEIKRSRIKTINIK